MAAHCHFKNFKPRAAAKESGRLAAGGTGRAGPNSSNVS